MNCIKVLLFPHLAQSLHAQTVIRVLRITIPQRPFGHLIAENRNRG